MGQVYPAYAKRAQFFVKNTVAQSVSLPIPNSYCIYIDAVSVQIGGPTCKAGNSRAPYIDAQVAGVASAGVASAGVASVGVEPVSGVSTGWLGSAGESGVSRGVGGMPVSGVVGTEGSGGVVGGMSVSGVGGTEGSGGVVGGTSVSGVGGVTGSGKGAGVGVSGWGGGGGKPTPGPTVTLGVVPSKAMGMLA